MSDQAIDRSDDPVAAWTARNLGAVVAVMARAVRDLALAFDLATELLAVAALDWDRHALEGSRMAWVLGLAPPLLARAVAAGEVPCDERMRNRSGLRARELTPDRLTWLSEAIDAPLELDPEAARIAARLQREAPAPGRLRRLALSPLVTVERAHEHS